MMVNAEKTTVRVEVEESTLIRLLQSGQVCAGDFRCLDCRSKQHLWRLCLKSCAGKCTGPPETPGQGGGRCGCDICFGADRWRD